MNEQQKTAAWSVIFEHNYASELAKDSNPNEAAARAAEIATAAVEYVREHTARIRTRRAPRHNLVDTHSSAVGEIPVGTDASTGIEISDSEDEWLAGPVKAAPLTGP
jgi:hypothetical protein